MSSDVVISCTGVGKAFQLYSHHNDQLKQALLGFWKTFYQQHWVLHDVTFDVHKGERIGIVGRNGAGKTTLLQIICGITTPTTGKVKVEGRIAPILALGAGFDGSLTGRENARIGGAILGLKRNEVERRLPSIADFAEIGPFLDQPMKFYSSGMIARLAFAICAHADADILIVDEALAVGDEAFQAKCERYIEQFARTGTILMVSHSLDYLRGLCDKVLWIEGGRVRALGEPAAIIAEYRASVLGETHQRELDGTRAGGAR